MQFDACGSSHHFSCVGMDASVAERSWEYRKCTQDKARIQNVRKIHVTHGCGSTGGVATADSMSSAATAADANKTLATTSMVTDSVLLAIATTTPRALLAGTANGRISAATRIADGNLMSVKAVPVLE